MVQIAVRRKACYLAIVTEENGIIILCQFRNVRENHILTYDEILDSEVDQFLNTNDMRDCLLASFGGVYTQKKQELKIHTDRLHGRDFVHYRKIEIDVNDRAVYQIL